MLRYVPIVDGGRKQWAADTLPAAAAELARAHQQGLKWDCRVRQGGGLRLLTEAESSALVAAIRDRLRQC